MLGTILRIAWFWLLVELSLAATLALGLSQNWIRDNTFLSDGVTRKHRRVVEKLESTERRVVLDAELGWLLRPGYSDPERGVSITSAGYRGSRLHPATPEPGALRVAVYGDSFAFGSGVRDEEAWVSLLDQAPGIEGLNYGVSAYGTDQALLHYRRGERGRGAQVVFIAILPENAARVVNRYRPFYLPGTHVPLGKPRFVLTGDELVLLENPLPGFAELKQLREDPTLLARAGENDFFFARGPSRRSGTQLPSARWLRILRQQMAGDGVWRPIEGRGDRAVEYATESEPYRVILRVIREFYADVEAHGQWPVVLILPRNSDLEQLVAGGQAPYHALLRDLAAKGLRSIDLAAAFADAPVSEISDFFAPDGHYSVLGNRRLASYLLAKREEWWSGVRPKARH
jgi:hypothetical protein